MPVGHVLVCDAGGDIEHDDTTLSVDVVSVTETSKLLLSSSIPDIELDSTQVLYLVSIRHKGFIVLDRGLVWHTVVNPRGWTSTPNVAMYFFSNSPVKWRLTKVVCYEVQLDFIVQFR